MWEDQQINMSDVAREAGVSLSTVSRALRNKPGVGEGTKARIKAIAERRAYVISPEASRLSGGGTGRVALVVPTIDNWFYARMLAAIERVLRDAELDVLLYHVEGVEDRRQFFERLPARRKVDALILLAHTVPDNEASRLGLMGVHVVVAGGRLLDYPCVRVDDVEIGHQATNHLIGLGHQRIAMIRTTDPQGSTPASDRNRHDGYRTAMTEAGLSLDDSYVVTVPFSQAGAAQAVAQLLSLREPPTAVFAYSDEIAIAARLTLQRSHVSIPERISILGVDDHPMAELHDLTTIRQPVQAQGELAAHLMLDLLHGREVADRDVVLPTELVLRRTTAPPPNTPTTGS
ncbi:MAG: LacI family DNA-binding transcriptional regulator [Nocardioidaceae bacterium]|nr:LacI family DNA-binding transcriptional regulator [Nocardioidaceae bacterium]